MSIRIIISTPKEDQKSSLYITRATGYIILAENNFWRILF